MGMSEYFGYSDKAAVTEVNTIYEVRFGSETTYWNSSRKATDEVI